MKKKTTLTKEEQKIIDQHLCLAVAKADRERIRDLLKQGANPDVKVNFTWHPDMKRKNFPDLSYRGIRTLVKVDTCAISMAVNTQDIDIVKDLIDAGANTDVVETLTNPKTSAIIRATNLNNSLTRIGYRLTKNKKIVRDTTYMLVEEETTNL